MFPSEPIGSQFGCDMAWGAVGGGVRRGQFSVESDFELRTVEGDGPGIGNRFCGGGSERPFQDGSHVFGEIQQHRFIGVWNAVAYDGDGLVGVGCFLFQAGEGADFRDSFRSQGH